MDERTLVTVMCAAIGAAGCGSKATAPAQVANRGSVQNNGTIAFATEDVKLAKLIADAQCACKMPDCDQLDEKIGTPRATERYLSFIDMPSGRDDVRPPFQSSFTLVEDVHWCANELRNWEVVRGMQCIQTAHGDTRPSMQGPRPTCDATAVLVDNKPSILDKPAIESWWTATTACPAPAKLVVTPNPLAADKLVRARCVETDEQGTDYASGRETNWHLNGLLRSDGTNKDGRKHGKWTWWYPHGLRAQEAAYNADNLDAYYTGHWTAWFPSGQKAWVMEYSATGAMTASEYWPNGTQRLERTADGKTRWWTRSGKELKPEQVANGYASEE